MDKNESLHLKALVGFAAHLKVHSAIFIYIPYCFGSMNNTIIFHTLKIICLIETVA